MAAKNMVQVLIDGKIYQLCGYEDEDYLNKVASYINNKLSELREAEGFRHQDREAQITMAYLNIADDYFKSKKQADVLEMEMESRNQEIHNLKRELINLQLKEESAGKELEDWKQKYREQEKLVIKMETELSALQKNIPDFE